MTFIDTIRKRLAGVPAVSDRMPDPKTQIVGGASDENPYKRKAWSTEGDPRKKIREWLDKYKRGGPYADAIDAYSLFTLTNGWDLTCEKGNEGLKDMVQAWLDQPWIDLDMVMWQGILSAILTGDAYQEIVPDRGGRIWGMVTRDPSSFRKEYDQFGRITGYVQYIGDELTGVTKIPIDKDRIINLTLFQSPGEMYGISIWDRADDDIQRDCDIIESLTKAIHRHGTPKQSWGIGSEENPANDTDLKAVRDELKSMNAMTDIVHRHDVTVTMLDTGGVSGMEAYSNVSLQRVACALGVPEEMLGLGRGSTEACYSADTQTLTDRGWKYYWEINQDDKIAAYNEYTGTIQYEKPEGFYIYDHDGPMYHFHNDMHDILVTPEHRMYLVSHHARFNHPEPRLQVFPAKAITYPRFGFLTTINQYAGGENAGGYSDDEINFIGFFLSEGSATRNIPGFRITLSQKKQETAAIMSDILCRLGFKEKHSESKGYWWELYNKEIFEYLVTECGDNHINRHIPEEFKNLPPDKAQILLDALILGDGTIDRREGRTHMEYCTTSVQMADDVQELAFKLGYRTKLKRQIDPRLNRKPLYRISMNRRGIRYADMSQDGITVVDYKGAVYCFELSTHIFITRRNGKIAIQGNTATVRMKTFYDKISTIQEIVARTYSRKLIDRITGVPGSVWIEFKDVSPQDEAAKAAWIALLRTGVDPDAIVPADWAREQFGIPPDNLDYPDNDLGPVGEEVIDDTKETPPTIQN